MDSTAVLGAAASASSILCQLVGLRICIQIVRKGGTDIVSPVPFITFFVSGCLWVKYGLILKNSNLVLTNVAGAVMQLTYICVFYVYTVKKGHFHRLLTIGLMVLFMPLLYIRYVQTDLFIATRHLGLLCCCMSVCCYASPFATVREVFRTKSSGSMSFMLVMFNFVSAICWFSYGTVLEDSFVALPNLMGCLLGLMQLALFCIYPSSHHSQRTVTPMLKPVSNTPTVHNLQMSSDGT